MKTDPYWCYENFGEAAELIDELEEENAKLRQELERLRSELYNLPYDYEE